METDLTMQGLALLLAMLMGAALGFLYDLMFPLRQTPKIRYQSVREAIYALAAGIVVFYYALAAPGGRLGTWELAAALLGYLFYLHQFSKTILPWIQAMYHCVKRILQTGKSFLKKIQEMTKMLFQYVRK